MQIYNTPVGVNGAAVANMRVVIDLMASGAGVGFVSSMSKSIISASEFRTDPLGKWTADLTPNASITPLNTYYRIREYVAEGQHPRAYAVVVPATGGPHYVGSILTTP